MAQLVPHFFILHNSSFNLAPGGGFPVSAANEESSLTQTIALNPPATQHSYGPGSRDVDGFVLSGAG